MASGGSDIVRALNTLISSDIVKALNTLISSTFDSTTSKSIESIGKMIGAALSGNIGDSILYGANLLINQLSGAVEAAKKTAEGKAVIYAINSVGNYVGTKIDESTQKLETQLKDLNTGIENTSNTITKTMSSATRLDIGVLSNERNLISIMDNISEAISANPYISETAVFTQLEVLLKNGVVFNVEQRAILGAISEKMESTFQVNDKELLELTRLQQYDLSTSQLSSRSLLVEFLNTYFEDNSYMNDMYDSVLSSITGLLSEKSVSEATEINYTIQKWLGSLYAEGASTDLITSLAKGINALGTGDVSYFDSNEKSLLLFGSATGGSYSDILVNGLDVDTTNNLLYNIVAYLSNIATDTNNVTKNVTSGLYGVTVSDLRAVSNLVSNSSDLVALTNSNYSFEDTLEHFNTYLMDYAYENTTPFDMAANYKQNSLFNLGFSYLLDDDKNWNTEYMEWLKETLAQEKGYTATNDLTALALHNYAKAANNSVSEQYEANLNELNDYFKDYRSDAETVSNIGKTFITDLETSEIFKIDTDLLRLGAKTMENQIGESTTMTDAETGTQITLDNSSLLLLGTDNLSTDSSKYASSTLRTQYDSYVEEAVSNNTRLRSVLNSLSNKYSYTENPYTRSEYDPITGGYRYSQVALDTQGTDVENFKQILGISAESYWDPDSSTASRRGNVSEMVSVIPIETVQTGVSGSVNYSYTTETQSNNSDSTVQRTLSDTATTVQENYANYTEGATEERDINSLYAELFEKQQHPIRVSLAQVEETAQVNLTEREYKVSDEEAQDWLRQLYNKSWNVYL